MGTIVIGSSANRKGITVNPNEVIFNGNVVNAIMSGVAEIWSSAKPLVPTMTSNTTPYGEVSASSVYSDKQAWKAFDNNDTTYWASNAEGVGSWIKYKFTSPTNIKKVDCKQGANNRIKTIKIQASNDGATWDDLSGAIDISSNQAILQTINISNNSFYLQYRIYVLSVIDLGTDFSTLQFYGTQLVGLVPTMTSNTTPYGEASASSINYAGEDVWYAFDANNTTSQWIASGTSDCWIQYKFPKAICAKLVSFRPSYNAQGTRVKNYKIQASNNGTTWDNLTNSLVCPNGVSEQYVELNNSKQYLYYRMSLSGTYGTNIGLFTLQFYGEKALYEPLIPAMTSNTTPSGVASASSYFDVNGNRYYPWMAFDNEKSTRGWLPATSGDNTPWLQYKFTEPTHINDIGVALYDENNKIEPESKYYFNILASNNGNDWTTLAENLYVYRTGLNNENKIFHSINNNGKYLYYRLSDWTGQTVGNGIKLQLYK